MKAKKTKKGNIKLTLSNSEITLARQMAARMAVLEPVNQRMKLFSARFWQALYDAEAKPV